MIAEPLFKHPLTRARVTGHQARTERVRDKQIVYLRCDCTLAGRTKGRRECPLSIPETIHQAQLIHPIQIFAVPAWSSTPGIERFAEIEIASDDPRVVGLWRIASERCPEKVTDPDVS